MDDLISRKKLLEQTAEWEAAALEQVGKLDPRNGQEEREEWLKWSAILQERSAFRSDVETAPAVKQKTGRWIRWVVPIEDKYGIEYEPHCKCSECDMEYEPYFTGVVKYCYRCGAKMENSDE